MSMAPTTSTSTSTTDALDVIVGSPKQRGPVDGGISIIVADEACVNSYPRCSSRSGSRPGSISTTTVTTAVTIIIIVS